MYSPSGVSKVGSNIKLVFSPSFDSSRKAGGRVTDVSVDVLPFKSV